ncbi:MAG: peptidylprolyl isomerase [Ardenticatenaceae bacterium]|nr:peptidylprolyl isomerase [Ardenticatenaceae bacterium]
MLEQLVEAYPDQVQLIYRHFPLSGHVHAIKAAQAAEIAGDQGQFWAFHDALFEDQREWSGLDEATFRDFLIDMADDLGLDVAQFTADLDAGTHIDYVNTLFDESVNLGLPGTPAVIFDGILLAGNQLPFDLWIWDAYVQLVLLEDRQYSTAPEMTINPEATYHATVTMESGDQFTIELLPQSAPQTVNSFIFLAQAGWFDGVTFHRVLPGFVAQTGDPTGTGIGGPGYTIPNEIDPTLSHSEPGMVAMANSGPDTNGSQWYITLSDVSQLDGSYTIFGRVIEGMDIVEAITPRDPSQNPNLPAGDTITSITIEEQ